MHELGEHDEESHHVLEKNIQIQNISPQSMFDFCQLKNSIVHKNSYLISPLFHFNVP